MLLGFVGFQVYYELGLSLLWYLELFSFCLSHNWMKSEIPYEGALVFHVTLSVSQSPEFSSMIL